MKPQDYEQLTLFPGASLDHASHLVLPGSEGARKMTVTSGQRCLELSKKSGPLGAFVKMFLESSEWHSTQCYLTWKVSATPAKRLYFRLVPSTLRTGETECALWPTPTTNDATNSSLPPSQAKRKQLVGQTPHHLPHKLLPTPRAQCANGTGPSWTGHKMDIQTYAVMFPTPTAQDYKRRGPNSRQQGLPEKVRALYPTPSTGAGLCGGTGNFQQLQKLKENGQITEEERRNMSQGNGGQLNPDWVCRMMGFPDGWMNVEEDGQTGLGKKESQESQPE